MILATNFSCNSVSSQQNSQKMSEDVILYTNTQGGTEKQGFRLIYDEKMLQKEIKERMLSFSPESEADLVYPKFPTNKKVVCFDLGQRNSGDYSIKKINKTWVKDKTLYLEVPMSESMKGGMQIQVMSYPWVIFSVPSNDDFNKVEITYSK